MSDEDQGPAFDSPDLSSYPEASGGSGAPPPPEPDSIATRTGMAALRVVGSIAVPVITFVVMWQAFEWLRSDDIDAPRWLIVLVAVVVGVGGIWALYWGMDLLVNLMPERFRDSLRPWVFVGPALVILSIFLIYPAINTLMLSFQNETREGFVGLENYGFLFTDEAMLRSIRNTVAWIIVGPAGSVGIGLAFAVLADKLRRGEAFAKSMVFLPMAVSFVGASVVWRFIYSFRPEGFGDQIGLLNGIWTSFGADPVAWFSLEGSGIWIGWNNIFMMVIMIWMQTGFAMVILSAAIKGVPEDILEAARIDGANEFQVFWRVIVPSIMSTIVVVTTTMVISVMKVFDIVFVMTNGEKGTEIIAERMIRWFFKLDHDGRGAAIAVILFLAIVPVMYINVRRFRAEEAIR